jgi:hypothetical protein
MGLPSVPGACLPLQEPHREAPEDRAEGNLAETGATPNSWEGPLDDPVQDHGHFHGQKTGFCVGISISLYNITYLNIFHQ